KPTPPSRPRAGRKTPSPDPEVLRQLQALALVVGAVLAVEARRAVGERLVDEARDGLAVLEQERRLVAPHLEYASGADAVGLRRAEAGVEEARVVDAELADRRVDRGHLGRLQHRDLDRVLGGEDVELAGIEQQLAAARLQRLPEVARVVAHLAVEV